MNAYLRLIAKAKPDGTSTEPSDPKMPATGDQLPKSCEDRALSKDVPLNKHYDTFIRIFRPVATTSNKLPVILYFHGGGFIQFTAASFVFHHFCANMAADLPALVLSVSYRLAPDHRLPAAYDDAVGALLWVLGQAQNPTDIWLRQANFSSFFIMGNSAGGNITFHLAIRAMEELNLTPIKLCGLIMDQPGFNGQERTESELRMENNQLLPMLMRNAIYITVLPEGANRDHEYCNPTKMKARAKGLPRCFVSGCVGDPLIDRQRAFTEMLRDQGVSLVTKFNDHGYHGIYILEPDKIAYLIDEIRIFINYDEV